MKTLLVVGAQGQLGRELMQVRGIPAGIRLVGVDRAACDITDPVSVAACFAAHRPDIVINAAAYTYVERAETEQACAFAVNATGAGNLAAACAAADAPLLHVSTDYVFDGSKATPWRVQDDAVPLNVYGASKLAGEDAVRARQAQHIILRTSWVFGQHGMNFVRTMVQAGAVRDELRVVEDQRGGPTWTGDLAQVLAGLALRHLQGESLPWGVWHYAGQPAVSWHAFACEIIREAASVGLLTQQVAVLPIATRDFSTQARRPLNSVLDMQDTIRMLCVVPPDWRVGLRQVLTAWRRDGLRF